MPSGAIVEGLFGPIVRPATRSPLLNDWVEAFDERHPLVDIGCAFGRNTLSAAETICKSYSGVKEGTPIVLACDCDQRHLEHVDRFKHPQVQTAHCLLPDQFPASTIQSYGGASGILFGEVLHFLSGQAIEETLSEAFKLLVPGGSIFITACSERMLLDDGFRQSVTDIYVARSQEGRAWPGESFNIRDIFTKTNGLTISEDERLRAPTFLHLLGAICATQERGYLPNSSQHIFPFGQGVPELTRACEASGFLVRSSGRGEHPGYPVKEHHDEENTWVIATKPRSIV